MDLEYGTGTVEKAKAGTADFLIELENQRAIKVKCYMINLLVFAFMLIIKNY